MPKPLIISAQLVGSGTATDSFSRVNSALIVAPFFAPGFRSMRPALNVASLRSTSSWPPLPKLMSWVPPFAQVTGSKGMHVWTPLRRRAANDEVRAFAGDLGRVLAARHPDELTSEWRKEKRDGRILVDTARNTYAQTGVPPYAVRPRPGAPVATPVDWDEVSDSKLRPDRWTVTNVLRRLAAKGDPWADIQSYARGISRARRQVESMLR